MKNAYALEKLAEDRIAERRAEAARILAIRRARPAPAIHKEKAPPKALPRRWQRLFGGA
jgi:hypothetical protein